MLSTATHTAARAPVATQRRQSRRQRAAVRRDATASAAKSFKVCVLGAAGGIGQPLSMLMAMNSYVSELALYDIANTPGVAADLSHCNVPPTVKGYMGDAELGACLKGADLVIIPAGVPRKPGMTRDDLFNINAGIVKSLIEGVAEHCPEAIVNIISNPVNSTVPIAAEVLKKAGVYNKAKLFGVNTLDVVRADKFVSEATGVAVSEVDIPVIGGHAGVTILPLLSQSTPPTNFSADETAALTVRIQNAGTEVVEAKAGAGSATLSMAYAAARFAEACLKGMSGEKVYECSFVDSSVTEMPFFSTKVRLGPGGAEEVCPIGDMSPYEQQCLEAMKEELTASINKGVAFANAAPVKA